MQGINAGEAGVQEEVGEDEYADQVELGGEVSEKAKYERRTFTYHQD